MKSWKTTACGVLTIVCAAITMIAVPLLDGKPETMPQYEAFGAMLMPALGLLFARDNNVTSEQAGAINPPEIK